MARGQLPASDPAHYLRGVQNVRERTNRWNADRLRSGVRRVAGISYGDTVPDPAQTIRLAPGADAVTLNREMRRARDANISRRREPKAQPRLDSLQVGSSKFFRDHLFMFLALQFEPDTKIGWWLFLKDLFVYV